MKGGRLVGECNIVGGAFPLFNACDLRVAINIFYN